MFSVVQASVVLSVPPVFAANARAGAEEMLDSMIMRYIPSLRGVVLSHSNLSFLDSVAHIQRDCPFLVCNVAFDATLWSPRVGTKLSGKVSLCSPDHISLLVHRTFNVSIPRHHIPTDTWEFEYGPAENDPEFGQTLESKQDSAGRWVHKVTGQPLDGNLEFTVIGLTVANEMLSLVGSLQPDPFSPRHTISQNPRPQKADAPGHEEDQESSELEEDADSPASDTDSDNDAADTFQALGKRKDLHDRAHGVKEKRRRV